MENENIYFEQLSMKAQNYIKQTEEPQPKYLCSTCNKVNKNFCNCFQRPINAEYNRCFNHSNYDPILGIFEAPENIEEIARANENKRYA